MGSRSERRYGMRRAACLQARRVRLRRGLGDQRSHVLLVRHGSLQRRRELAIVPGMGAVRPGRVRRGRGLDGGRSALRTVRTGHLLGGAQLGPLRPARQLCARHQTDRARRARHGCHVRRVHGWRVLPGRRLAARDVRCGHMGSRRKPGEPLRYCDRVRSRTVRRLAVHPDQRSHLRRLRCRELQHGAERRPLRPVDGLRSWELRERLRHGGDGSRVLSVRGGQLQRDAQRDHVRSAHRLRRRPVRDRAGQRCRRSHLCALPRRPVQR